MYKLLLNKYTAYPWFQSERISFRGYFISNGNLYKGEEAISFLLDKLNKIEFKSILLLLNGLFSIIICGENEVYFATDRLRCLPLFYAFHEGDILVSDNAQEIYNALPKVTFDPVSIEDFKANGLFVSGASTLYREIKQVQAGEWVCYKNDCHQLSSGFYFTHADENKNKKTQAEQTEKFRPIFKEACNNLVIALDGRTAVVSLSGGTDSRELLLMLHTAGYKKVLCFSYGKKGSLDCTYAKKLAGHFGYPWIEITYTRKLWRDLRDTPEFISNFNSAGNFAALPHIQDILAVKILHEQNIISRDSVFLPGHAGAIAGGNFLPDFLREQLFTYEELIEKVIQNIYNKCNSSCKLSQDLIKKIKGFFDPDKCNTNEESEAQYHCFIMKERQAKFIINSVRAYEIMGYEWLLPLCDLELLNFMKTIPLYLKHKKKFIRDFMGLNSIPSTSDDSVYKFIADKICNIPPLCVVTRKLSKIPKYFASPVQTTGLYGFYAYLKGCVYGNQYFSINDLINYYYISSLKEKNIWTS
ncbi:MAG: asparagine synthase-related protein [Acetivibrionales bacterium]|jgi:asparagine synthase (glutamine-hydrolysing)